MSRIRHKSPPFRGSFSFHGVVLEISAPPGPLAEAVAGVLGPFAVDCAQPPVCRLVIRNGQPPAADDGLKLVDRSLLSDGREIRHFADAHRRVSHIGGMAWHRLDLLGGEGEIVVLPGEEWCLEAGSLTPMLCEVLAWRQCHILHGATLVGQTRTGPRAVVLAGISGAGKTTTALALARAGLPLLADDATVLARRDGALRVFGLPRPCKVHRQTLALLDWLRELEPNPRWHCDEFLIAPQRVSPSDPNSEFPPGLLIGLLPRNSEAHRFEPWDRLDAMTEMTRQNVRAVHGLALPTAAGCFEAVGDLVANSRTLRLSVGPDLASLAAGVRRELEE